MMGNFVAACTWHFENKSKFFMDVSRQVNGCQLLAIGYPPSINPLDN